MTPYSQLLVNGDNQLILRAAMYQCIRDTRRFCIVERKLPLDSRKDDGSINFDVVERVVRQKISKRNSKFLLIQTFNTDVWRGYAWLDSKGNQMFSKRIQDVLVSALSYYNVHNSAGTVIREYF